MAALGACKVLVCEKTKPPRKNTLDKYDMIISDSPIKAKKLSKRDIKPWEWIKECIIKGRIVSS